MRFGAFFLSLAIGFAVAVGAAQSQSPQPSDKPLRFIVPYAAGGGGESLLRLMTDSLRTKLERPVIVENKPGAAGRLGVQYVKGAPADGSVLLFTPIAPMSVFPHVYQDL